MKWFCDGEALSFYIVCYNFAMSNQSEVKFMEQNMSNDDNKKNIRLNFLKGSQSHSPSQTNVDAKVQINIETAIPKLEKIAQKYVGIINP